MKQYRSLDDVGNLARFLDDHPTGTDVVIVYRRRTRTVTYIGQVAGAHKPTGRILLEQVGTRERVLLFPGDIVDVRTVPDDDGL